MAVQNQLTKLPISNAVQSVSAVDGGDLKLSPADLELYNGLDVDFDWREPLSLRKKIDKIIITWLTTRFLAVHTNV